MCKTCKCEKTSYFCTRIDKQVHRHTEVIKGKKKSKKKFGRKRKDFLSLPSGSRGSESKKFLYY